LDAFWTDDRVELTGRCITDFIHRNNQNAFYYQKLNCQKHSENSIFELKMKSADGRLFDAQLHRIRDPFISTAPVVS
jgi:hypothetical protein